MVIYGPAVNHCGYMGKRGRRRERERELDLDTERDTDTDDLFIQAIAPREGVRVDDLPPHSTNYNCAYEQENQQTNDNVLDSVLTKVLTV